MEIGIIGLGDMGLMYANKFLAADNVVNGCDLPSRIKVLSKNNNNRNLKLFSNGFEVVRRSEIIFFSVESSQIAEVIKTYGPAVKCNSIVAGQTSIKTEEVAAFKKYLPKDVNIITCHSLHGPDVSNIDNTLVVIDVRSTSIAYRKFLKCVQILSGKILKIESTSLHDKITADTQVITHLGFLSIAEAWRNSGIYPWEDNKKFGGLDNIKILVATRILSGKSHVYSSLAFDNTYAKSQISQYRDSVSELFKLIVTNKTIKLKSRINEAVSYLLKSKPKTNLLTYENMGKFHTNDQENALFGNSHLSLLGMIDAWYKLKINPYKHMICQTPLFRLRLGLAEKLVVNKKLLEKSLNVAVSCSTTKGEDLEFYRAVNNWSNCILNSDTKTFNKMFLNCSRYFRRRNKKQNELYSEFLSILSNKSTNIRKKTTTIC